MLDCRILHGPWMTTTLKKTTLFEDFLRSLSIITTHLRPAFAYNREFNTQLSITAYINSSPKNGVFAVQ